LQVDRLTPIRDAVAPRRQLASGIAALAGGEIAARVIAFAATAWLTRRLGPEGYGVIGFATAISGYFLIVAGTGFNDIGAREVAREPQRAAQIAASTIAVRLPLALAAWLCLGALALLLPKPAIVRLVVFMAGLSFISQALDTSWVFKGLERNVRVGVAGVCTQTLYAIGILSLVRGPNDLLWVPVLQFGGELVAAIWIGAGLFGRRLPKVTLGSGVAILRASGFVTLSRLLRVVILTGGVVLLGLMAGERAVGFFSASYRFCFLLMAIAGAIHTAYLPSFSRAAHLPETLVGLTRSALAVSALIGAPLVVGSILVARIILPMMFGSAFVEATLTFQLLLISIGFVFIHGTLHNVFLVVHRTHVESALFGVAALVMLVLNVVLIPSYAAAGAALAVVIAEATIVTSGWLLLRRLGVHPGIRPLVAPVTAAMIMAATLLALPRLPLPAVVLAGAATYAAGLWMLGGFPRGGWSLLFRPPPTP